MLTFKVNISCNYDSRRKINNFLNSTARQLSSGIGTCYRQCDSFIATKFGILYLNFNTYSHLKRTDCKICLCELTKYQLFITIPKILH